MRVAGKGFLLECGIEGNDQRIRIGLLSHTHCIFELHEVIAMQILKLFLMMLMRMLTRDSLFGNEDFSNASLRVKSRVVRMPNSILYHRIFMNFVDSL
jgi:hypothetical protein